MTQGNDDSVERIVSGEAWSDFCEAIKAAGQVILDERSPASAFDRAEGFRYLSRLVRAGLESCIEGADPLAPELLRICHETIKMGADNPDNYYQSAPIRGSCEYRVSGTRGTVHYLGFGTYEGSFGGTGSMPPTGYLDDSKLHVEADGRFELVVSAREHPGNWLPMNDRSRSLVVRQTFLDRQSEAPATLRIERIDGPHRPRPATARSVDRGLRAASLFVAGCSGLFAQWAADFERRPNELPRFDPRIADAAGGAAEIAYYHGYWKLAPAEALVIEVRPPACDYWNFQLNNHWMESLDYRYFRTSVNKHTTRYRPDGSAQIVVAHEDPGVDNWVETAAHDRGTMCLRWVRAREHPDPITRVVPVGSLRAGARG